MLEPPCGKIAGPGVLSRRPPVASRVPPRAQPHLADDARDTEEIHTVMREETLVFGGEDRFTDDRRYLCVLSDVAVLVRQLDERLALRVVNVADGWKLEPRERPEVWQVAAVVVEVPQLDECACCRADPRRGSQRGAPQQDDDAARPGRPFHMPLDSTGQGQNQKNQQDHAESAAGPITPATTMRPRRKDSEQHQHRENDQNRDHEAPSPVRSPKLSRSTTVP